MKTEDYLYHIATGFFLLPASIVVLEVCSLIFRFPITHAWPVFWISILIGIALRLISKWVAHRTDDDGEKID